MVLGAMALGLALPTTGLAQGDPEHLGRMQGGAKPPPGYYEMLRLDPTAFQFSRDNGWIRRGQAVAAQRNALRAAAASQVLFAPMANINGAGVMRGDLNVPVFLILFANTNADTIRTYVPRQSLETRLYGTTPAPPYSIHTYYREISNDSLLVNGTVFEWTQVSQPDTYYEAGCNGTCAQVQFANMVAELVQAHDDTVDFGHFDNDGADGVPNSGDDDGYVDAIVLMHPEVDGSCTNVNPASSDNIWAHRYVLGPVSTADAAQAPGITNIRIRDYIIQGGQGGDAGCSDNQPQAMGVVAHETGHLFGLPDLYDVNGTRQGIGHWGLMGSGNWNKAYSPAHMEAWSRAQLGWVSEVLIASDTLLDISPVQLSDTAYILPIVGSNEYFLLENRQAIGSDALIHAPGLLIWHVDSVLVASRMSSNTVNTSLPHGVSLEEADGFGHLKATSGGNRGDAGDPFPGSTSNTLFGVATNPSSARNDGLPTNISVGDIEILSGTQTVRTQIRFRQPTVVMATDTVAAFLLDGSPYNVFSDLLDDGSSHQLEMDAVQLVNNGRNRYTWQSWSNGQPRSHTFTATSAGDTIVADVAAEYMLDVDVQGTGGSVASTPVVDIANGELLVAGSVITLVATVDQPGHIFEGWTGDSTGSAETFAVTMGRPYSLTATFAAPLVVTDVDPDTALMGAAYQYQLQVTGGIVAQSWSVTNGALPQGVTLRSTGELSGVPRETGSFSFTGQITSGSQTKSLLYQLEVAAPALATADVVAHVTGTGTTLSAEEVAYLDLLGNNNGEADTGDFFAWVEATGVSPTAEVMAAAMRVVGEEKP